MTLRVTEAQWKELKTKGNFEKIFKNIPKKESKKRFIKSLERYAQEDENAARRTPRKERAHQGNK